MSTVYGNCATFEPSDKLANVYGLGGGTFCLWIKQAGVYGLMVGVGWGGGVVVRSAY